MRRLAWLTVFVALGAPADPAGTVAIDLEVGETAPVKAAPGANVLCDDLQVVTPEFTADGNGFVLRGRHPGTTLCGVWLAGQNPGGLYRVHVVAKKAGETDAGPADAGGG